MKIIFFGLGSIGNRQAKILLEDYNHEVFAYRTNKGQEKNHLGIKEVYSWSEVKKIKPDIAFITNPTSLHVKTALRCASLGMHLFIEKPLSNSMKDISALMKICRDKDLTAYVAYNMRFIPIIKKIKQLIKGKKIYHVRVVCSSYLPHWRPGVNHLKSYSSSRKLGGGVLLDLSHEFDYIKYLFGPFKTLQGKFGRISDVAVDAEDYADIVMTLESCVAVNLHLNFMSLLKERKIIIDYKDGYCIGDLIRNRIIYVVGKKEKYLDCACDRNSSHREQMQYFFHNLNSPKLMNNLKEASILLKKILEFKNG